MLNKRDFTAELMSKIDELYETYLKAETANAIPGDDIFPDDKPLTTPEFHAQGPVYTHEEMQADIDQLAKEAGAEKIMLAVGKVSLTVLAVAMKAGRDD